MQWLDGGQSAMMQALDHGPAHLPQGLFTGSPERVLAGMKVHANTISHARLVALEDTFQRTRQFIGHESFNAHSRLFIQQPGVTGRRWRISARDFRHFCSRLAKARTLPISRGLNGAGCSPIMPPMPCRWNWPV